MTIWISWRGAFVPSAAKAYNLFQRDDSHYECQCGWKFTISDGDVFASNDQADETHFDVFA